jgi:hypothetical protein
LFQPDAPGDGDDAAAVGTTQVETLVVEDTAEGQIRFDTPQEDAEADEEVGQVEV